MSVSGFASSIRLRRVALLASTALVAAGSAQAQANWTGTTSSDWATAANWSTSAIPAAGTNVTINTEAPNPTVVSTAGQAASSVTLGSLAGQSGDLTVTGAGRLNVNNATVFACCFLVGDFGSGELTVSAGGVLTTAVSALGNNATGVGLATVTGAGSEWVINNGSLDVGSSGQGTLNILAGGRVWLTHAAGNVAVLTIGRDAVAPAHGRVFVSGTGSEFRAAASLVGSLAPTSGEVQVSNGGLFAGGATTIGSAGDGIMTVDTGGDATATSLMIAASNGSTSQLTVTGAGSTYAATGALTVGNGGAAELTVSEGGVVTSASGSISAVATGSGEVTVTGAGSRWAITNQLQTGAGAPGAINVLAGGVLSAASFTGARSPQITVSGAGSQFNLASSMTVGASAPGSLLDILDGGRVSALSLTGSNSMVVNVDGVGSQLNLTGALALGQTGAANRLNVLDGGVMTSGAANLTAAAGAGMQALVSGSGSSWTANSINIGGAGASTLRVEDGGLVSVTTGATGDLIVDGAAGTQLTISDGGRVVQHPGTGGGGQFRLGVDGHGTLLIESGGVLELQPHATFASFTFLARNTGSSATATVAGAGSRWTNSAGLIIGSGGPATLSILNGGTVDGYGGATIAGSTGVTASVLVSGAGSNWTYTPDPDPLGGSSNISLGVGGSGSLRVEAGGTVTAEGMSIGGLDDDFGSPATRTPGAGSVVVTGATSRINLTTGGFQSLEVGEDGSTGVLDILAGARVHVLGQTHVARSALYSPDVSGVRQYNGTGTINIDGAGSQLTMTQRIEVGEQGIGVVNILGGGLMASNQGFLGSFANARGVANGTVDVSGAGSTWTNSGLMVVGD